MAYQYYPYNTGYPFMQQQAQAQQQPIQMQPQIQSGGIIHATEEEARKYPVAPGYSMTFIDDEKKRLYTKTAGFSQLEAPTFEIYRITKENTAQETQESAGKAETPPYATKAEIEALRGEFEALRKELNGDD